MPAITFTVSRSGDLTKTGSVTWTLSGGLQDADLVPGQPKTGTLSWPANDTTSRTVTINTKGNTVDNANRACTITLSAPVNAKLGVATATTTVLDDDVATAWPADFNKTPPTFSGTVKSVNTRDGLVKALGINAPATGDIRVSCAAGVDYGTISVNKPGRRVEIVAETAPFGALDTTKREDLAITAANKTNARDKVVRGTILSVTQGAGMNLIPEACSVLWVENFYFRPGQRVVNQSADLNFDTWLRRCRLGDSEGGLIRLGGTSKGFKSLCLWGCWLWGNGDRGDAAPPNAFACYTDYGCQLYEAFDGVYVYNSFFEEGMSHLFSCKKKINKFMAYDNVFMPYTSLTDPHFTVLVTVQLGQEGTDERGEDYTCGMAVFRGNTFGSWTERASTMRHSVVAMQDANGCIMEDNLFYSQASHIIRMLEISCSPPHVPVKDDIGPVFAGAGGVRIANNKMLGRTPVTLGSLYSGVWGGCNVRFEENDVPGTTLPANRVDVGTVGSKVNVSFGTNPGYRT
jgi:hypothetical protein